MVTSPATDPTLRHLRERLAAGDLPGIRSALLALSPQGRDELEIRLGKPAVDRMLRSVRGVSRSFRGRVVVIHGIMGGKLATRDASGDEDLVWMNIARLALGRIGDFALDDHDDPADPSIEVITCGLLDEYLPMLTELDGTWQVLPFAFDWRLDIAKAADKLDEAIRGWANGEPCHIVAHSMGGLVSRQFIRAHGATWRSMADPNGLRSGGRLVMLGTPNRGSFAISLVLTGEEKIVKMLERFDFRHDMPELLGIIDAFPGSFQMLPTPKLDVGDDRARLHSAAQWKPFPVDQRRIDLGLAFQSSLDAVIDPERLVYVAGYDQPTPWRIKVNAPGKFAYQETRDGDGRVPHELGLLPGVATFYVKEAHGDLPSNERVLAGIHDLLQSGSTTALEATLPATRAAPSTQWKDAATLSPVPPEVDLLLAASSTRGGVMRPDRATEEILASALIESFVGSRGERAQFQPEPVAADVVKSKAMKPIELEVMWGDLTRADGQVFAAGHYQGVMPQNGELALDKRVSGIARDAKEVDPARLVITTLAKRGVIRAAVGDVNFFPWAGAARTVAIAGMGHPGTFGRNELQRLARGLIQSVAVLPKVRTVNTLLIGSGTGNLQPRAALEAMLAGMIEAFGDAASRGGIRKVRIVEVDWRQAQAIHRLLARIVAAHAGSVKLGAHVVTGQGGRYSEEILLSLVAAAASRRYKAGSVGRRDLARLLADVPKALRPEVEGALEKVAKDKSVMDIADILQIADGLNLRRILPEDAQGGRAPGPTRISYLHEASGARVAAIADTAVVPERILAFNWKLVDELVAKLTDPADVATIPDDASLLAGFVVPPDFRDDIAGSATMIFEVDRDTARIPWEMLADLSGDDASGQPLALARPVARQLRTTYSPPPSRAAAPTGKLRALVVGDPGDPAKGLSLPGARREAIEVAKLLQSQGVDVTALIGAPSAARTGDLALYAPASMLEVISQLRHGCDILHYSGHGDFNPDDPGTAGWLFGSDFFTARELGAIDKAPRLTVANACLSGLVSGAFAAGALLPGLADEFFKRGARNYIGTAWEVNDEGAILFATTLYAALLDPAGPRNLGEALLAARSALKAREANFGALWAAYHHYGDPEFALLTR